MPKGLFRPELWTGTVNGKALLPVVPLCGRCGLYKTCHTPKMPLSGKGKRKILFIAEAPGETEDQEGTQLIGKAGKCLRTMLSSLGVDLEGCWKTNSVICRPPGNVITDLAIDSCRPNVTNALRDLKPEVVVLLGTSAVKSVVGLEWGKGVGPLSRWLGWTIPSNRWGCWLVPTYHPSYLLRMGEDQVLMKVAKQHLKTAIALEGTRPAPLQTDQLSKEIEVITDVTTGRKRIEALNQREGELSFDWETTGKKPERKGHKIYSASFCLDGKDTFATLIDESCYDALRKVMLNRKLLKIGSNLKFENRWSMAILGVCPVGWIWDTMLSSHFLDNRRGICSVKFQSYIHLGIGDYDEKIAPYLKSVDKTDNGFNRIHLAPVRDLLLYNGLDSLITYMISVIQREKLYGKKPGHLRPDDRAVLAPARG